MRRASISGLYSYIPQRSCCFEKITVHSSAVGMVASEYFPAGSMVPLTETGSENVIDVASLAPVRHTSLYGTRPPQIARPLTPGRLYEMSIFVVPTVCEIAADGDTRGTSTWAAAGAAARATATSAVTAVSVLMVRIASTPFASQLRQRLSNSQQEARGTRREARGERREARVRGNPPILHRLSRSHGSRWRA